MQLTPSSDFDIAIIARALTMRSSSCDAVFTANCPDCAGQANIMVMALREAGFLGESPGSVSSYKAMERAHPVEDEILPDDPAVALANQALDRYRGDPGLHPIDANAGLIAVACLRRFERMS